MAEMNLEQFHDDSTGDALRRLQEDGADLAKPHQVDFAVAVPSEEAGQVVAEYAQMHGFETDLLQNEESLEWDCYCSKWMVPTHQAITAAEQELDAVARKVGGHADGWGAFPVE